MGGFSLKDGLSFLYCEHVAQGTSEHAQLSPASYLTSLSHSLTTLYPPTEPCSQLTLINSGANCHLIKE